MDTGRQGRIPGNSPEISFGISAEPPTRTRAGAAARPPDARTEEIRRTGERGDLARSETSSRAKASPPGKDGGRRQLRCTVAEASGRSDERMAQRHRELVDEGREAEAWRLWEAWTEGGGMLRDVLALDANAFMRHAVRRYLCALQEERGGNILLPAEALREAKRKYPAIAGGYARRAVGRRWSAAPDPRRTARPGAGTRRPAASMIAMEG